MVGLESADLGSEAGDTCGSRCEIWNMDCDTFRPYGWRVIREEYC